MCLKRILCCSFHGWRNFGGERFLTGKHLTSSGTKTTGITDFKLCTHISNRMLNKNVPSFFLTRVIFYFNNSTSFESLFCMKTIKSRLFNKYLKRTKSWSRFWLPLGWLHIGANKLLNSAILLVQELIKYEK